MLNWHRIFLVSVHSQDSPQDPLRILLENIMPMLSKNIIIENKIRFNLKFPSNTKNEKSFKNIGIVINEVSAQNDVNNIERATFPLTNFVA